MSVREDFARERQECARDRVDVRTRACMLHVLTRTSWGQLGCGVLSKQEDFIYLFIFYVILDECYATTLGGRNPFPASAAKLHTVPGAAPAPSTAAPASAGILGSQRNEL